MVDPPPAARSGPVNRQVGFRDVGVMRRYELGNDGRWRDALLMDLLRDELLP